MTSKLYSVCCKNIEFQITEYFKETQLRSYKVVP